MLRELDCTAKPYFSPQEIKEKVFLEASSGHTKDEKWSEGARTDLQQANPVQKNQIAFCDEISSIQNTGRVEHITLPSLSMFLVWPPVAKPVGKGQEKIAHSGAARTILGNFHHSSRRGSKQHPLPLHCCAVTSWTLLISISWRTGQYVHGCPYSEGTFCLLHNWYAHG